MRDPKRSTFTTNRDFKEKSKSACTTEDIFIDSRVNSTFNTNTTTKKSCLIQAISTDFILQNKEVVAQGFLMRLIPSTIRFIIDSRLTKSFQDSQISTRPPSINAIALSNQSLISTSETPKAPKSVVCTTNNSSLQTINSFNHKKNVTSTRVRAVSRPVRSTKASQGDDKLHEVSTEGTSVSTLKDNQIDKQESEGEESETLEREEKAIFSIIGDVRII